MSTFPTAQRCHTDLESEMLAFSTTNIFEFQRGSLRFYSLIRDLKESTAFVDEIIIIKLTTLNMNIICHRQNSNALRILNSFRLEN